MTTFGRTQIARRPHTCAWCNEEIRPGQRYERVVGTPDEDGAGDRWVALKHHIPVACPLANPARHNPPNWPIDTPVRYWTGVREGEGKVGRTRGKPFLLSGHTPVVFVTGHGACIALTHVQPIEDEGGAR